MVRLVSPSGTSMVGPSSQVTGDAGQLPVSFIYPHMGIGVCPVPGGVHSPSTAARSMSKVKAGLAIKARKTNVRIISLNCFIKLLFFIKNISFH
jgi:hypothetical protein